MLKNFDLPFKDLDGNIVKDGEKEKLLRSVIIDAIQGASDTNSVDGEEKYKRFKLIDKIYKGGEVDISIEEAVTIKKCVGSGIYTPLAVGRVYEFLES